MNAWWLYVYYETMRFAFNLVITGINMAIICALMELGLMVTRVKAAMV